MFEVGFFVKINSRKIENNNNKKIIKNFLAKICSFRK